MRQYNNLEGYKLENTKKVDKLDKIKVTVQHPVKGTLIFGQNRENKISVSSLL